MLPSNTLPSTAQTKSWRYNLTQIINIWFDLQAQRTVRNNTPLQLAQSSYTLICISIYDMFDMQIKDGCLRHVVKYSCIVCARLIMNAFKNRKRQLAYRAGYIQLICTAVIYSCQEEQWTQYQEIRKYQSSTIRVLLPSDYTPNTHDTFSDIFVQQIFATINNSLTTSNTTCFHPTLWRLQLISNIHNDYFRTSQRKQCASITNTSHLIPYSETIAGVLNKSYKLHSLLRHSRRYTNWPHGFTPSSTPQIKQCTQKNVETLCRWQATYCDWTPAVVWLIGIYLRHSTNRVVEGRFFLRPYPFTSKPHYALCNIWKAGQLKYRGSIPSTGRFVFSSKRPEQLWSPGSLLFPGQQGSFLGGKVAGAWI